MCTTRTPGREENFFLNNRTFTNVSVGHIALEIAARLHVVDFLPADLYKSAEYYIYLIFYFEINRNESIACTLKYLM